MGLFQLLDLLGNFDFLTKIFIDTLQFRVACPLLENPIWKRSIACNGSVFAGSLTIPFPIKKNISEFLCFSCVTNTLLLRFSYNRTVN